MSSFIRRIQRQIVESQRHYEPGLYGSRGKNVINPAREKFYMGRGSRLGITNPKSKDLIARLEREKRHV